MLPSRPLVFVLAAAALLLTGSPLHAQLARPSAVRKSEPAVAYASRPIQSEAPPATGRRILRGVAGAVLGAAIGGGAGYAVAAVRCGRRKGCAPAEAYPYPRFGVVAGAAIGGGLAYGVGGGSSFRREAGAVAMRLPGSNAPGWLAIDGVRLPMDVQLAIPTGR